MNYEVGCVRPGDRPKKTWSEVIEKDIRSDRYARNML